MVPQSLPEWTQNRHRIHYFFAFVFLLLGLLFVIPIVLVYTAWTYWVFRGKVRAGEGYH